MAYGFYRPGADGAEGTEFLAGATPELLFELRPGNRLVTMAVAGTRPGDEAAEALETSPKDRDEHQSVVEDLLAQVSAWGPARAGQTEARRFGTLQHLVAEVRLDALAPLDFETVARRLHPTPALGVYPRGPEGTAWLASIDEAGNRGRFGAPFGLRLPSGAGRCLVAIRCLQDPGGLPRDMGGLRGGGDEQLRGGVGGGPAEDAGREDAVGRVTPNQALAVEVVERLWELGVRSVCLCAGGRNAPLVEALEPLRSGALRVFDFFEERSAAFFALGRARRERRPVAVVTTSGTAARRAAARDGRGLLRGNRADRPHRRSTGLLPGNGRAAEHRAAEPLWRLRAPGPRPRCRRVGLVARPVLLAHPPQRVLRGASARGLGDRAFPAPAARCRPPAQPAPSLERRAPRAGVQGSERRAAAGDRRGPRRSARSRGHSGLVPPRGRAGAGRGVVASQGRPRRASPPGRRSRGGRRASARRVRRRHPGRRHPLVSAVARPGAGPAAARAVGVAAALAGAHARRAPARGAGCASSARRPRPGPGIPAGGGRGAAGARRPGFGARGRMALGAPAVGAGPRPRAVTGDPRRVLRLPRKQPPDPRVEPVCRGAAPVRDWREPRGERDRRPALHVPRRRAARARQLGDRWRPDRVVRPALAVGPAGTWTPASASW